MVLQNKRTPAVVESTFSHLLGERKDFLLCFSINACLANRGKFTLAGRNSVSGVGQQKHKLATCCLFTGENRCVG